MLADVSLKIAAIRRLSNCVKITYRLKTLAVGLLDLRTSVYSPGSFTIRYCLGLCKSLILLVSYVLLISIGASLIEHFSSKSNSVNACEAFLIPRMSQTSLAIHDELPRPDTFLETHTSIRLSYCTPWRCESDKMKTSADVGAKCYPSCAGIPPILLPTLNLPVICVVLPRINHGSPSLIDQYGKDGFMVRNIWIGRVNPEQFPCHYSRSSLFLPI